MNYNTEKKTINLSMIILFLSLMTIYVFLFYIKWDYIKKILNSDENNIIDKKYHTNYTQQISWNIINNKSYKNTITTNNKTKININKTFNTTKTWNNKTWNIYKKFFNKTLDNKTWICILSGTRRYNWPIEIVNKLWLKYYYSLVDDKDIYFVKLKDNNINESVRKIWWSIYELNTEEDIIKNNLFWNKITYINIPKYKNKIVIMIIDINNENWLIKISYKIYYSSKQYLKNILKKTKC